MRPILIQGAHPPEVDKLVRLFLPGCEEHCIDGFKFWDGMMQLNHVACRVVVSITGIGLALASASVVIAKQHFNPIAIINQGIAGGHTRDVQVGDIIVGEYCVNLNSFKTPFASQGAGSNSLTWKPKKSRGSGGGHEPIGDTEDMSYIDRKKIKADAGLLTACKSIDSTCRVIFGGIGTSETWNSEVDRIDYLHALFGTLCEEMEAIAVAQIAEIFRIPFISIRVISNNIMNHGEYALSVTETCQDHVLRVVESFSEEWSVDSVVFVPVMSMWDVALYIVARTPFEYQYQS